MSGWTERELLDVHHSAEIAECEDYPDGLRWYDDEDDESGPS